MIKKTGSYLIIACTVFLALSAAGDCRAEIELPVSPLFRPLELAAGNNPDLMQLDVPADQPAPTAPLKPKNVSRTKAVFLSLLLPGSGHFYLGEKGRGEVFIGAEVVSWAGVAAFQIYGNWKEDDYVSYAEQHAGIQPEGKDEEFFKNLTFYDSRDEYNTSGRIIDPNDPYYPNTPDWYWQWDSDESKSSYRDIRNQSETAYRNRDFAIGMAVLNRIIAGIDAFRLARKIVGTKVEDFAPGDAEGVEFDIDANPFGSNPKFKLTVSRQF